MAADEDSDGLMDFSEFPKAYFLAGGGPLDNNTAHWAAKGVWAASRGADMDAIASVETMVFDEPSFASGFLQYSHGTRVDHLRNPTHFHTFFVVGHLHMEVCRAIVY